MTLKTTPLLSMSLSHTTFATQNWLSSAARKGYKGIAARDSGFFIPTVHCRSDSHAFPPDLNLCLSFAAHNDVDYVLIDMFADCIEELPVYDQKDSSLCLQRINMEKSPIGVVGRMQKLEWSDEDGRNTISMMAMPPAEIDPARLRVDRAPRHLEDAEYVAQDGCWIEIGDVAVRIATPTYNEDLLRVTLLPKDPDNRDVEFGMIEVLKSEVAKEIEHMNDTPDPAPGY